MLINCALLGGRDALPDVSDAAVLQGRVRGKVYKGVLVPFTAQTNA